MLEGTEVAERATWQSCVVQKHATLRERQVCRPMANDVVPYLSLWSHENPLGESGNGEALRYTQNVRKKPNLENKDSP